MKEYIDKAAVKAEIKKLEDEAKIYPSSFDCGRLSTCKELMNFIDTLETKEVGEPSKNLEKEIQEVQRNYKTIEEYKGYPCTMYADDIEWIAKHFFELGLKAQKGE